MNNRILLFYTFLILSFNLSAQIDPAAHFSFDDCTASDNAGTFNQGSINGSINCDCGVGEMSNAFHFDGGADTIVLDQAIKTVFEGDFSIGFYVWIDGVTQNSSILSIQGDCATARDSAFFVRYLPAADEIVFEFSKNFGEVVALRANLLNGSCWNHVLFTKSENLYSLYLNGEFVESVSLISPVVLGQDFPIYIGASPCIGLTDNYFNGRIDDLKFYNTAIKEDADLSELLVNEDRIITQDTTIFEGTSFILNAGSTCANQITWSPGQGLSSTTSPNPTADPIVTTTYTLSFDHGVCVSEDQITVSVISEDQIDCNEILLPNAFTPNNDGLNDTYGISNDFIIEDITRFEIYNRWGMKLWETINKSERWDGTFKGEKMPSGTYVYKVEYQCLGQTYRNSSSFNILK